MTKAGLRWDEAVGHFFFEAAGPDGGKVRVFANSRPDSVRAEVEESLKRLGVDRIDLLQIHWPDPTTPIAETMGELLELREAGKIAEIGVSNYSPAQMQEAQEALGDVPLASDQPKYNLVSREIEADVLPWVIENEVGTLVYSPLEQGLLTGRVRAERTFASDDGRSARPTFRPENRELVNGVLDDVVAPIAEAKGATIGQVVIAWTVSQPGVTSALVGARSPEQVAENAGAGEVDLTDEELARIRGAFEALELGGASRKGVRKAVGRIFRRK